MGRSLNSTLGIRTQTILLCGVPLAFLVLLLFAAGTLLGEIESTTVWSQRSTNALEMSDSLSRDMTAANQAIVELTKARSPAKKAAALKTYHDATVRVTAQQSRLESFVKTPAMTRLAAKLNGAVTVVMGLLDRYRSDFLARGKKVADAHVTAPPTRKRVQAWLDAKTVFDKAVRAGTMVRSDTLRQDVRKLGIILIAVALLGIGLTLVVAARFGVGIVRRLSQLAENAQRLAAGELPTPISGRDEISQLDAIYRELTQRLQVTVRQKEAALEAYAREHDVASTLQRALLPQQFPEVRGLRVDSVYRPASQGQEIGGDWYDVFQINDRLLGLSVGDVAGHGVRAASMMAFVRRSLRVTARFDDDPAEVLTLINRALCTDEGDILVTAFFGTLNLDNGKLRYALAGHAAPLTIASAGKATQLPGGGVVLGFDVNSTFDAYEAELSAGSGLLLFTDGIVEIERDYFKGMADLESAFEREWRSPSENVAENIQRTLFEHAEPHDDSALLFVRVDRLPAAAALTWTIDARDPLAARRVRREVVRSAGERDPEVDLAATEAIFGEAIGNVARHTPGWASVSLLSEDGELILDVEDHGAPFEFDGRDCPDATTECGRGAFLMRTLSIRVSVSRTPTGNRVSIVLPQAHSAGIAAAR